VKTELIYIDAVPEDDQLLTETAMISKKTWGYSDDLMTLWKPDLEVSCEYILKNKVVKVFDGDKFVGFFGLKLIENNQVELDNLWFRPGSINKGYGRLVFQHIVNYLKLNGCKKFGLVAEPNAKGFYDKMGGNVTGQFQSKVSGRFLDVYEYEL
jgi:hypothetical protein